MDKTKLKNANVSFQQYYGTISITLRDPISGINIAKIDTQHLAEYIKRKIKDGQIVVVKEGKGRFLTKIELV